MTKAHTDENELEITKEAYDSLVEELEYRKSELRDSIAKEIAEARDLGDLSENHAYAVAMEKKELNENRIAELEEMIKISKVITKISSNNLVSLGKKVEIENIENSSIRIVTLVGSEETKSAEPGEGKISVDSPIGKAIHNAKLGDIVDVILPEKTIQFKILKFV